MQLRPFRHGVFAAALLTVVALLPATSASAVPVLEAPVCPQAKALTGLAIAPAPALAEPDYNAVIEISAGALPAGVLLTGDRDTKTPYVFRGTPTATGTFTFTVKRIFEDAKPLTTDCTMTVGTPGAVSRIAGTDRYDQAGDIAAAFDGADTVYIASGTKFPDALSAGSVAGLHNAPLLLAGSDSVPAATLAQLDRLRPDDIVLVGGEASLSEGVRRTLADKYTDSEVMRIGGADRYAVSRALIADRQFGSPKTRTAYLATGTSFPDALSASPAAIQVTGPLLLVRESQTSFTAEESTLLTKLGVKNLRIAGGPASVSAALEAHLAKSYTVTRASGADRYEAAVSINKEGFPGTVSTVYLASGTAFADALSAAPVAGVTKSPVYLVKNGCVPNSVLQEIVRLEPAMIVVLGGTATLSPAVESLTSC
ncbi:cell wall-binding repeat-containing protein [Herbiconiux sp. CPCC 203407]|uniref:Cell wall-binding repeat-containing protein n=1 Tax=Herbiconiux oxytropis TaxID=2970915 RepID=A0AA41XL00_9MICO|nr:cell wall-binding repeat-containing protein [Herbiconiux oxytropis]MCS5724257.1 cell wall-binding repeat-containing protein [Herbiconiux oxytropis]MCS5728126.1 cell wall-binding repeat-containing protein [Herbiconiux oxytropis]